ncbi:MAG: bifunctional precorrin-2 dehydrogenase/sirohydrochlorin ferrochelatase [Verrucomicrobia bacterium]|nr:bifunctional precorrin-2 dehydrogenase/sirohydrochlorin ferrochelatase [Verrucomicrobiota bacterium]
MAPRLPAKNTVLYPIFLELKDARCVVVGGGQVAQRKAQSLLAAGARVKVVALTASERIESLAAEGKLEWIGELYRPDHLDGARLVYAATDDPQLNTRIAADARARDALTNVAEPPAAGDFMVPATLKRGDIVIALSTGGASPALAKKLRERLEEVIGEEYGALARLLGELRPLAEQQIKAQNKRQQLYEEIVNSNVVDLLRAGKHDEARRKCEKLLAGFSKHINAHE